MYTLNKFAYIEIFSTVGLAFSLLKNRNNGTKTPNRHPNGRGYCPEWEVTLTDGGEGFVWLVRARVSPVTSNPITRVSLQL